MESFLSAHGPEHKHMGQPVEHLQEAEDGGLENEQASKPKLEFFFSAHGTPEDYAGIEDALAKADIFVVEAHGWQEEELKHLQAISNGDKTPRHIEEGREPADILEYEEGLVYGTGKKIEFVDVPEGHELAEEDDGSSAFRESAMTFIAQGDLAGALEDIDQAARKNADYLRKKDAFVEQGIRDLSERATTEHPGATILIQMGSSHSGISHDLRKEGRAERVLNTIRYNYGDQLVRSYRFGKEPSQELVTKALAEQLLKTLFKDQLAKIPYLQRITFFEKLLKNMTEDQMRGLGEAMGYSYADRVIMGGEDDTPELNREIFSQAWLDIMGFDVCSRIQGAANEASVESLQ